MMHHGHEVHGLNYDKLCTISGCLGGWFFFFIKNECICSSLIETFASDSQYLQEKGLPALHAASITSVLYNTLRCDKN